MNEAQISIGCVSNIYVRQMHFARAGDVECGHSHPFDHLSLLATGSVSCCVDGKVSEFKAPAMIFIKKDVKHEFIALEDGTLVYCVHALRVGHGVEDIIDPASIPNGVNAIDLALPVVGYSHSQPPVLT